MAKRRTAGDAGGAETVDDVERLRSGFDSTNWNAAVALQCTVRDTIGRTVTMEQALRLLSMSIRTFGLSGAQRNFIIGALDAHDAQVQREKAEKRRQELEGIKR